MKKQTSTVKPEAGTLKQQISRTGSVIRKASLRIFAFLFLLSMSLPNRAFVQDEIAHVHKSMDITPFAENNLLKDSCCTLEKPGGAKFRESAVWVMMPSEEMIRKADNEAIRNLVFSLREQRSKPDVEATRKGDEEIDARFREETRISLLPEEVSDLEMDEAFRAENILLNLDNSVSCADEFMDAAFRSENAALPRIQLPGIDQLNRSDDEIGRLLQDEAQRGAVRKIKLKR